MAWVTLTIDVLKARMPREEYEQYDEATGNTQDFDQVGAIIAQVIGRVRASVATCRDNLDSMGPPGTIPDELLYHAGSLLRSALVAVFPVVGGETEPRKAETAVAKEALTQVASCELAIAGEGGTYPGSGTGIIYGGEPQQNWSL